MLCWIFKDHNINIRSNHPTGDAIYTIKINGTTNRNHMYTMVIKK